MASSTSSVNEGPWFLNSASVLWDDARERMMIDVHDIWPASQPSIPVQHICIPIHDPNPSTFSVHARDVGIMNIERNLVSTTSTSTSHGGVDRWFFRQFAKT